MLFQGQKFKGEDNADKQNAPKWINGWLYNDKTR